MVLHFQDKIQNIVRDTRKPNHFVLLSIKTPLFI